MHRTRIGLQESSFFEATERDRTVATRRQAIPQFELLETSREERRRRWASFGVSSLVEVLEVAVLVWLLTLPRFMFKEPKPTHRLWFAGITLPPPSPATLFSKSSVTHAPHPPPRVKPRVQLPEAVPKPVQPPVPPVTARFHPRPVPQPPSVAALPPRTEVPMPAPRREPQAHVGAFSGASTAVAALRLPRPEVQTGGFGNPNGLPGEAKGGSRGNVPTLGFFDQPGGPGSGNGSGGEHGVRGVVASAGFGSNIAGAEVGHGAGAAGDGQVHSGGFADARSLTQAAAPSKSQPTAAAFDPVEITSKPKPVYTEEARRLHVQGEVVLRVMFRASGQVQILGVNQGLGHGLDEAAIRAAQQIQFKPARRNGQPVDTTATLQILFQLAD